MAKSNSSLGAQTSIAAPEPIDRSGLLELLDTRINFHCELFHRFESLRAKVDALPVGLQFDIVPEYGAATVVGYKLVIKL